MKKKLITLRCKKVLDIYTIYNASTEEEGRKALDKVTEKWEEKYPRAMKRRYDNWDAICPIFKF